jgi:hypothetical protein
MISSRSLHEHDVSIDFQLTADDIAVADVDVIVAFTAVVVPFVGLWVLVAAPGVVVADMLALEELEEGTASRPHFSAALATSSS